MRSPDTIAARIRSQAIAVSPRRPASWRGCSAARKACAAPGSPYPRRTRTLAVTQLIPSAPARALASSCGQGRIVHVPCCIVRSRYGGGRRELFAWMRTAATSRFRLMNHLLNVFDYERRAAELLPPGPLGYFSAGAGDEWTLRENVSAYRRWTLRPRLLRDVAEVTTARTVLGHELAAPIIVAPMAYQRHAHPDGEVATARAAAAFGTIMTMSTMATSSPAEVAAAAPEAPRWFQLYVFRDEGVTRSIVDQAVAAGFRAIVLTIDAPYFGRRERDPPPGRLLPPQPAVPAIEAALGSMRATSVSEHFELISPSISWRDVERLASETSLPVLVKGIHTAEGAALAVEHRAAGNVLSNHGGRQLDGVAASVDVLPEVVEAVGERVELLVDGGIRRGVDVMVALALGARAVLVGRPVLWGLAVDGANGAERVLRLLRCELKLTLGLCGCCSPDEVTRAHVARAI